ncbi:glycosyltransferase family 2 protein [Vicingus serpentipes]|uniref:Glycosyltransferase family 2 protein n=1 Tax=Vicingus serpentipes TaxID=1926625 RepID=A0A5C6RV48_9FLAO|nr:glycosyltransferase family A protein [Vicingus serpentipes]TXB65410.1 glycosyltransferase family 2 protein [Vicingus serpentipes]
MSLLSKIKAKYHFHRNKLNEDSNLLKWKIKIWFNNIFDSNLRNQIRNPKNIPVIIISYNQLFHLKQLVDFLLLNKHQDIVIIDNNSTYIPLLTYFDEIEKNNNVTIHKLRENFGHLVFWKNKELFEKYSKGYHIVTDADIVPHEKTPSNYLSVFLKLLNTNKDITKVGFSLYLDDIPDYNPNKKNIINWENQFWQNKINKHYLSSIDTTFAMYRPNYKRNNHNFLSGIRTNKPYTARHGGWYINPKALTEEQLFYIKTANSSSSWLTNENGELVNDTFKNHYTNKND